VNSPPVTMPLLLPFTKTTEEYDEKSNSKQRRETASYPYASNFFKDTEAYNLTLDRIEKILNEYFNNLYKCLILFIA